MNDDEAVSLLGQNFQFIDIHLLCGTATSIPLHKCISWNGLLHCRLLLILTICIHLTITTVLRAVDIVGRKVPFPVVGCNRVVPL